MTARLVLRELIREEQEESDPETVDLPDKEKETHQWKGKTGHVRHGLRHLLRHTFKKTAEPGWNF